MWNFLAKNPEVILFILVGAASVLGRLRKAIQSGQGPGGIRIPPPAEIRQKAPIAPRTAPGHPAPPARVQPVRRPGRPKPRPKAARRPAPQGAVRPRPSKPEPEPEAPKRAVEPPVESHFEEKKAAEPPVETAGALSARGLLAGRDDLRRAVLMAEVLGRPLALR